MNSLPLNAHRQRLYKNQSPNNQAPHWVTTLKDLLNKKQKTKKTSPCNAGKHHKLIPRHWPETKMLFFWGGGGLLHLLPSRPWTQTENCSRNINASAFTFFFFYHHLRHHVREAAATLAHICLHLVFIECTVTVRTCISNPTVSWKLRHETSCSFDLECVIGAAAPSVCSAALMRTFSIAGVICDGHDKAKWMWQPANCSL